MPGYVYKGAKPERGPNRTGRQLQPCGTRAAARRHEYNGEELCGPCEKALEDHKDSLPGRRLKPCGHVFRRHRHDGEKACRQCEKADA